MALKKIKLGELIEICDERNSDNKYTLQNVKGISIQKIFIETKADMQGVSLKPYKIVKPDYFAYVTVTSRNGEKITLAYNDTKDTYIVSSSYVVFKIKRKDLINSHYLFMYFNRPEFDRYSRYNSWGSARETFSWDDMCDIELELPDLLIQKKYVNIYSAMLKNQLSYERGLEDLKLVCESYIEDLRKKSSVKKIGKYIKCTDRKTDDINLDIRGISNLQKLSIPNSRVDGVEKEKYLRIDYKEFGYSPIHINDGSIALNNEKKSYLLSPIYKTFKVIDENVLYPDYLMMWFLRKEFVRYCWFYAFGSARDNFEWNQMCEVEIPIPDIKIQKSISNIYKCYIERQSINELLKNQIKDICPILIKGSVEEAKEN